MNVVDISASAGGELWPFMAGSDGEDDDETHSQSVQVHFAIPQLIH